MVAPIKIVCFTKEELIEAVLSFEEDTEAKWFYDMEESACMNLRYQKDAWWFQANRFHLKQQPVLLEHAYEILWKDQPALLYVTSPNQDALMYSFYSLEHTASVLIGRGQGEIRYDHVLISSRHARLIRQGSVWILEDLQSKNGFYVNHQRKKSHVLKMGDCVDIMGLQLLFGGAFIALNHTHTQVCARLPPYENANETLWLPKALNLPALRAVRPYVPYEMPVIPLEDPPAYEKREEMPLLYVLGPSLTMCFGSIASSLFTLSASMASNQPLSASMPSLVMAGTMLVSTLVWPLFARRYERQKQEKVSQQRAKIYDAYIAKQRKVLAMHMRRREESLRLLYRSSDDLDELWSYELAQKQLYVCLGIGDLPVPSPFQGTKTPLRIDNDALLQQRDEFLQAPCILRQIPILIHATSFRLISCIGREKDLYEYARYLLVRHALLYAPKQALVLLAIAHAQMDVPRFLPHLFNESGYRYLCCDKAALHDVLIHLKQDQLPVLALSFEPDFTAFFTRHAKELVMVLFAFHPCEDGEVILSVKEGLGQIGNQDFHWQKEEHYDALIRLLCNIPYDHFHRAFPKQLTFFAMYRYERVAQFQIAKRWSDRSHEGSLCAALGVGEDGARMILDLHERSHGPHGIVAGMTGSGKSELLITMLLSLACNYHPYDCAFILIDYKGGGMAKALQRLPHTAGIITNLDGSMIERSLNSLHAELLRRQRIFAQVMDEQGLASMNIDIYQTLFHEKRVHEIIPHLIIVADEFAELKQQEGQFMEQLIRIARIGRSLGIHLILATQKPSGVVDDQIWSNARFHICLKVADQADSMDMLKRKEGAQIRAVGRFYLQVGYDELFTQGQCAYAKAPYDPQGIGSGKILLSKLENNGSIRREWKRDAQGAISEMDALICEICAIGTAKSLRTPRLWLPPLSGEINPKKLAKGEIGMVDDPWNQRQFPLSVEAQYHNTLLLAQEMQEVSQGLMTLVFAYMEMNERKRHHVVILDGGHGELCQLSDMPHIYAALSLEEEADVRFVMQRMLRKKREGGSDHHWLLVIHNVGAFLEQYEEGELWVRELVWDHGTSGILVWLSAMSVNDVPSRLYRHFENLLLFHMQDEQEVYALLGARCRMGKARLRAMWKQLDHCYEVQIAQPSMPHFRHTSAKKWKMPRLPQKLFHRELAAEKDRFAIGISFQTREALYIPMQGTWIISGPRYREQLHLWKQLCEACAYTMSFPMNLDECMDEGMEVIALAPDQLNLLAHHPRFVSLREEGRVLWYGGGFAQYQYLWNLRGAGISCAKQEGLWLKEEVVAFLSVSAP